MKISFSNFGGMRSKAASYLLKPHESQLASNIDPDSGEFASLKKPGFVASIAGSSVNSFVRWTEGSAEHWIGFSEQCDFFTATDDYDRIYFTGQTQPRFFANDFVSDPFDPAADYIKMGVPTPTAALTASGYTPGSTYRAYIYTFVNRYGDEGPPSPLLEKSDYGSGNVTIAGFSTPTAGHAVEFIRVYRTNAAAVLSEFQLVFATDLKIYSATATYNIGDLVVYGGNLFKCMQNNTIGVTPVGSATEWDDWYDGISDGSLQPDTMVSSDWEIPPDSLRGLVGLPNGSLAGFVGDEVFLSEPGYPHAWPQGSYSDDFRHKIPFAVVAIAVHGSALIVLTTGPTYLLFGSIPDQMVLTRIPGFYPCLSKISVAAGPSGIFYASRQGLAMATYERVALVTADSLSESDWQEYIPTTMHGAFYNGRYICFYGTGVAGLMIDIETGGVFETSLKVSAVWVGDSDGILYLAGEDEIDDPDNPPDPVPLVVRSWASDEINYLYGKWKSGTVILPFLSNFGAARVVMDDTFYDRILAAAIESGDIVAANAAIFATGDLGGGLNAAGLNVFALNGDLLQSAQNISTGDTLIFSYFADGVLKFTKSVTQSGVFRLPAGFRARTHELQIEGYPPAQAIEIAHGIEDLMQ